MPPASQPFPYRLITNDRQLAEACAPLKSCTRLAVDTEFVGEKYYRPRLELVQVTDGTSALLIDAPAISNWGPFAELLASPTILKIFHAGGQDLPLLHVATGAFPAPIYDTQIACSFLGYGAQVSLANLIRAELKVEVSSKQTTSDWGVRPFTPDQLVYAASDVQYLHLLEEKTRSYLVQRGRLAWFEAEQADASAEALKTEAIDEWEAYRRVKDWLSLSGVELAIIRELAAFRERTAREKNLPRKTVLTDDTLVEMANFQPTSREKALKLRRVHPGQVNKYFEDLQQCIKDGRTTPRDQWPQKPVSERLDIPTGLQELCQSLIRTEAEKNEVAPTVVCTSSELTHLINNRRKVDALDSPLLHGWRHELAGTKLLALLRGETAVVVGKTGELEFLPRS